ncbi:mediator of RNA polymerase II transcription subunit 16 [Medicago truncatula]|uniref:Mediator of RNA polymerase II transcription subunit 16 n=1 Tax=Medicago truncatula TaxID=3880 RepID=G7KDW2_MEDTR|nr:mediator of RNA polymerase II transcription subunit 16 [Medicago truncatula]
MVDDLLPWHYVGYLYIGQTGRAGPRLGTGNGGQGYTKEEVNALFVALNELSRRTAGLQHPLPVSQVGSNNIQVWLHYIEGSYTVLPEAKPAAKVEFVLDEQIGTTNAKV